MQHDLVNAPEVRRLTPVKPTVFLPKTTTITREYRIPLLEAIRTSQPIRDRQGEVRLVYR